jgi:hypothetical protein
MEDSLLALPEHQNSQKEKFQLRFQKISLGKSHNQLA